MEQESSYRPSSEAFAAYFAGEISSEEKQVVEQWVDASDVNRGELEQLRQIWLDTNMLRTKSVSVDLNAAFEKVKHRKEVLGQSEVRFSMWKIAAGLLLLLTVSWWFWKPSPAPLVFASEGVQEISLSDGSVVTLNDQTILTYPVQFDGNQRTLQLQGEAFFSVEEDKERPFRIQAGPITVTVLGTEFNVNTTEEFVEVSVSSGRVEVWSDFVLDTVDAGQQILLNLQNETTTFGSTSLSGTEFYWIDQKLTFEGVELQTVLRELNAIFDVTIDVGNEAIMNCRLQATFEGQSFDEIIEIIALSQNLEVTVDGTNYLLIGEGCVN